MERWLVVWAVVVLVIGAPGSVGGALAAQEEAPEVPPGVQQLLPRGGIPAVFDPQFVPADRAEIPDSAWVLGVVIKGEARAYSLNLLNHHEIVNDVVGGLPVAPVW